MTASVRVYKGDAIARYGFGAAHPFSPDRHAAFHTELAQLENGSGIELASPVICDRQQLMLFHTEAHIDRVERMSATGSGYLDGGDTPAVPGIYEAACAVVGTTLAAVDAVLAGEVRRAFVPIAGLHHAARDHASGFCVFNDCGVAIEHLKHVHGLSRVAYVDIDVHHGDGVYYAFESDPAVVFADIHEDGRYLFPGTGGRHETGIGEGAGLKINLPLAPGDGDARFREEWAAVETLIEEARPEFILLQCGADGLAGDPLAHLTLTEEAHGYAASRLCMLADRLCDGRLVATGGGGYDLGNLARAWTRVVEALAA